MEFQYNKKSLVSTIPFPLELQDISERAVT